MISKALIAASTKPLILSILLDGEAYGYQIMKKMKVLSGGNLRWSFGMLYPVLHRLDRDGLILSRWEKSENGRHRKYYRLSDAGRRELEQERTQWLTVHEIFAVLWESSEACS